jgi:Na+-driven multidrug efflux pump
MENQKPFLAMALPQMGTMLVQGAIGQATTLTISQLGELAIGASSAVSAVLQLLNSALVPTLSSVAGIRVGFYLGEGSGQKARRAAEVALVFGLGCTLFSALLLLIFGHGLLAIITDKTPVVEASVILVPAVALTIIGSMFVQVFTQGILTSQGRPLMVTILSFCFELPLSLGSCIIIVLVIHGTLLEVYWAEAAAVVIEAIVCIALLSKSNWRKFAHDARVRNQDAEDDGVSLRNAEGDNQDQDQDAAA